MQINIDFLGAINGLYKLGLNKSTSENFHKFTTTKVFEEKEVEINRVRLTKSVWFRFTNDGGGGYHSKRTVLFDKHKGTSPAKKFRKCLYYEIKLSVVSIFLKYLKKNDIKKLKVLRQFIDSCININGIRPILTQEPIVYSNISSLCRALIEILTNTPGAFRDYCEQDFSDILRNFLALCFGKTVIETQCVVDSRYSDIPYMRAISNVFEIAHKNLRFFILQTQVPGWNDTKRLYKKVGLCHSNNRIYDYIDAGRLILDPWSNTGRYRSNDYLVRIPSEFLIGTCVLEELNPKLPSREVLNDYCGGLTSNSPQEFLNNDGLLTLAKNYINKINNSKQKELQKAALTEKLQQKLTAFDKDLKLKINDVVFTADSVEYQGQQLSIKNPANIYWVKDLLTTTMRALDRLNFETVFEAYLSMVFSSCYTSNTSIRYKEAAKPVTIEGRIGDIDFTLEKKVLTNVNGVTSERIYINENRINREEIVQVLRRALCFNEQSDFNYFCKEISKCSLKTHRFLYNGIECHPYDNFLEVTLHIKFILERKIYNYLKVGERLFKIKDTARLTSLAEAQTLMDIINVLLSPSVVDGITIDDITVIIDGAQKDYTTAVEKSEQLLRNTEKLFKISVEKYPLLDGSIKEGYLIKGKLRTYLLEAKEAADGRNGVYEYPSGRYICIVDKSNNQVGKDKLVNRIFALHNDELIAQEVSTLR